MKQCLKHVDLLNDSLIAVSKEKKNLECLESVFWNYNQSFIAL